MSVDGSATDRLKISASSEVGPAFGSSKLVLVVEYTRDRRDPL